jgi:hypothetical protein
MARELRVKDPIYGDIKLYVIHESREGVWSKRWDMFQTHPELQGVGHLFSRISYESYQDALYGHARNLITELSYNSESCFIKTPDFFLECLHKKECPTYHQGHCKGNVPKVPICYQANIEDGLTPDLTFVFDLWRQGFYIIIVPDYDTHIK